MGFVSLFMLRRASGVRGSHPEPAATLCGSLHARNLVPTLESLSHLVAVGGADCSSSSRVVPPCASATFPRTPCSWIKCC